MSDAENIKKLFSLMSTCCYSCKHGDIEYISRKYILEKIQKLINGETLILDHNGKRFYNRIKDNV